MKSGLNEAMDGLGDEIIEEYRPQQDEGNNIDEWSKKKPKTIALIFFAYYWLPNYLIRHWQIFNKNTFFCKNVPKFP